MRERTIDLNDLLKINSGSIESWADCCSGSEPRPMETERLEMRGGSCKEPFIFGSWNRSRRRSGVPIITRVDQLVINGSESLNNGNNMTRKKSQRALPESQRSSTYRPASYESSSFNESENRSALDSLRDDFLRSEQQASFDEDNLWCPRCGDRMTEPRLLACLHPICTPCVNELFSQAPGKYCGNDGKRDRTSYGVGEGCPVCDHPLPHTGSPVPPPHYPLQHRLVMNAVRRRLSHRVLCCDLCAEEVQASVHCPTCLGNFCASCGSQHQEAHENERGNGMVYHQVRPLWEAKRFRRTTLCLEHPAHALRFHCIACRRVTCRECMWRGPHRGHASEDASGAGRRATAVLIAALQRARTLLNSLLIEYDDRSFTNDESIARQPSTYNSKKNNRYSGAETPSTRAHASTLSSHAREAQERIHEFARLQRARYLLDAISLGEELLAEGSDVEILSLSRIILKRLHMLGSSCSYETTSHDASEKYQSRSKHAGVFHCCTFCSSGGKKEATCACRGSMPGGYMGCGHGHPGHPRVNHWSCCGSTDRYGSCLLLPKLRYQVIL